MKPPFLPSSLNPPPKSSANSANLMTYDPQKRSNSHNVITEYNIYMTPKSSNPSLFEPKKTLPATSSSNKCNISNKSQHFEYLLSQKPQRNLIKLPIKEMLKTYSGLISHEKKPSSDSHDKKLDSNEILNEESQKLFTSLSHREPVNLSLETLKTASPRKLLLNLKEEETSEYKMSHVSSNTSNKIKKMLMTSPYNTSKALVNGLKALKNLSHSNLAGEDRKPANSFTNFPKSSKGFVSNFNISRKNLVKLSANGHALNKGSGEKINSERNTIKNKEIKQTIQEESTIKNSISYKSTNNTSKSADKVKDRQSEELVNLFNRAKGLLVQYKMREMQWRKEKEQLLHEINLLKAEQKSQKPSG